MTMNEQLRKQRNARKYLRRKLMYPSHLTRTGHRYKAAKDKKGNRTGLCEICGERQTVRSHSFNGALTAP